MSRIKPLMNSAIRRRLEAAGYTVVSNDVVETRVGPGLLLRLLGVAPVLAALDDKSHAPQKVLAGLVDGVIRGAGGRMDEAKRAADEAIRTGGHVVMTLHLLDVHIDPPN